MKHVVDKGKSQTPKDKVGENFYNRGVLNSMHHRRGDPQRAEASPARRRSPATDMRRGLETLEDHGGALKEIGCRGLRGADRR